MIKFHKILILFAALVMVRKSLGNEPISELYPYGENYGDVKLPTADDNFVEHVLSPDSQIFFFNQGYDRVFINNNGGISFVRGIAQFTPTCGPSDTPMIIPFWADVDSRDGGTVWYRETNETEVLSKATREVLTAFPGLRGSLRVNQAMVITWHEVAFFGSVSCGISSNAKRNTFQTLVALGDDGHMAFIIFNYEKVNWVTGKASGGNCNGTGGTPAKAGFDTGDNVTFFSIPGSCSCGIANLVETTNVNQPGKWIFRIDQEHIEDPADPVAERIMDDPVLTEEETEPGMCKTTECSLHGYCYSYARCDLETQQYRVGQCSHGLYWNPHGNSTSSTFGSDPRLHPTPIVGESPALGKAFQQPGQLLSDDNNSSQTEDYALSSTEQPQEDEEACEGSCDIWENLSPNVQHIYLHDQSCFPGCTYAAIAECENRYLFHAHNTDARSVHYEHCPVDIRAGMHNPLVWVQERESCDFCYNAYRTDYNGTVSPCCDKYDAHPSNDQGGHAYAHNHLTEDEDVMTTQAYPNYDSDSSSTDSMTTDYMTTPEGDYGSSTDSSSQSEMDMLEYTSTEPAPTAPKTPNRKPNKNKNQQPLRISNENGEGFDLKRKI